MFFNDTSGFEEGYAKKDNLEIYYRDYGPVGGIPVLLVMGLGGQLTSVSYTHLRAHET